MQKTITMLCLLVMMTATAFAQSTKTMLRLPDTGQNVGYTTTFCEDNDYNINLPFFINNNNGTTKDTITGLV
jgi:hypothetical protein